MIMLPSHPDFYSILHSSPPPGWQNQINSDFHGCFAVREDSLMLMPLTPKEEWEYLNGGEYDSLEYLEDAYSNC